MAIAARQESAPEISPEQEAQNYRRSQLTIVPQRPKQLLLEGIDSIPVSGVEVKVREEIPLNDGKTVFIYRDGFGAVTNDTATYKDSATGMDTGISVKRPLHMPGIEIYPAEVPTPEILAQRAENINRIAEPVTVDLFHLTRKLPVKQSGIAKA